MKRSALFHHHEHSGATLAEYQGWQLPSFFTTPEAEAAHVSNIAGLADISYRAKFETAINPAQHGWRLSQGRYLAIGDPPLEMPESAADLSSVYANLLLAGPRSRDVLGKV